LLCGIIALDDVQFASDLDSYWFNYLIVNGCMVMKGYSLNRNELELDNLFKFDEHVIFSKKRIKQIYRDYIKLDYPNISVQEINRMLVEDDIMDLIVNEKESNSLVLTQVGNGLMQIRSRFNDNNPSSGSSGVIVEDITNQSLELNEGFRSSNLLT